MPLLNDLQRVRLARMGWDNEHTPGVAETEGKGLERQQWGGGTGREKGSRKHRNKKQLRPKQNAGEIGGKH